MLNSQPLGLELAGIDPRSWPLSIGFPLKINQEGRRGRASRWHSDRLMRGGGPPMSFQRDVDFLVVVLDGNFLKIGGPGPPQMG